MIGRETGKQDEVLARSQNGGEGEKEGRRRGRCSDINESLAAGIQIARERGKKR